MKNEDLESSNDEKIDDNRRTNRPKTSALRTVKSAGKHLSENKDEDDQSEMNEAAAHLEKSNKTGSKKKPNKNQANKMHIRLSKSPVPLPHQSGAHSRQKKPPGSNRPTTASLDAVSRSTPLQSGSSQRDESMSIEDVDEEAHGHDEHYEFVFEKDPPCEKDAFLQYIIDTVFEEIGIQTSCAEDALIVMLEYSQNNFAKMSKSQKKRIQKLVLKTEKYLDKQKTPPKSK